MSAKFIVRLDDACPTMDHDKWSYLENLFDEFNIKPLIAVIPDNTDESLIRKEFDSLFWNKVSSWQKKGWAIGLHGYKHDMHSTNAKQILPFYKRSEFSGLPLKEQSLKIRKGYEIFHNNGIKPSVWIAPAHCFDKTTLKALSTETSIKIISDGIAFNQYYKDNFYWIPQQLWSFKEKKYGLWTVCLHPNSMSKNELENFKEDIIQYKNQIISIDEVKFIKKNKSILDRLFSFYF